MGTLIEAGTVGEPVKRAAFVVSDAPGLTPTVVATHQQGGIAEENDPIVTSALSVVRTLKDEPIAKFRAPSALPASNSSDIVAPPIGELPGKGRIRIGLNEPRRYIRHGLSLRPLSGGTHTIRFRADSANAEPGRLAFTFWG